MEDGGGGRISLRLELESGSEPISGRLVAADGAEVEFTGWLELAAAIERHAQPEATGRKVR
ncbi:MAG: hypothetical protein M3Y34_01970 [Actinomycetota bacterium]|nr:hypothetical protein [Actinomycetota bacterium]